MKDWNQTSASRREHSAWNGVIEHSYRLRHPEYEGRPINITEAQDEACRLLGLPEGFFRVRNNLPTAEVLESELSGVLACKVCGEPMDFEVPPSCPAVNPKGFSGLFACRDELCPEHFYTIQGLVDVRNLVRSGQAARIIRVNPAKAEER
ncbi:MAG: hypothetical protein KKB20_18650 [Proteobacteria bacterium]|nr:hypothetical protein [Pseudomonadota bacterium]